MGVRGVARHLHNYVPTVTEVGYSIFAHVSPLFTLHLYPSALPLHSAVGFHEINAEYRCCEAGRELLQG